MADDIPSLSALDKRVSVMESSFETFEKNQGVHNTTVVQSIKDLTGAVIAGQKETNEAIETNRREEETTRQNIGKWLLGCMGMAIVGLSGYVWHLIHG